RGDPVELVELAFDAVRARGAGHPADRQLDVSTQRDLGRGRGHDWSSLTRRTGLLADEMAAAMADRARARAHGGSSGAGGGVSRLLDRGEDGVILHGLVGSEREGAALVADLDLVDAGDLADLLADGHLAVPAGHAAHAVLVTVLGHSASPTFRFHGHPFG